MTSETAATLIGQRFGVTVAGAARDLTVAVPPDRWVELATCAELGYLVPDVRPKAAAAVFVKPLLMGIFQH